MLGLGWTEMLVIGVMALIFIGPKDLPVVMNRVGKMIGQIRRMGNEFQREINKTTGLDEVRNLRNSITGPLKKTTEEIRREFNAMTPTGPKPSGVIKPTDPAAESVVAEIKAKAGMSEPATLKTSDEVAAAAGFKPAGPAPTTSTATFGKPALTTTKAAPAKKAAARKSPARAKAVPTSPVVSTDLAPIDLPVVDELPSPATPAPAKAAKPKTVAARKSASPKPAAGAKPAAAAVTDAATDKPAPRKRAPAKPKPTDTTAVKAGDE